MKTISLISRRLTSKKQHWENQISHKTFNLSSHIAFCCILSFLLKDLLFHKFASSLFSFWTLHGKHEKNNTYFCLQGRVTVLISYTKFWTCFCLKTMIYVYNSRVSFNAHAVGFFDDNVIHMAGECFHMWPCKDR